MQFITRVLIVLAVLGGLGYGSYAFGKYILSARLFGPQSKTATTTASTGTLQNPSAADVEIVPAPQKTVKSAASDAPEIADSTATPDENVEATPSDADNNSGSTRDLTRNRPDPTPRPRRRRRRPTPRPEPRERPTAAPQIQAPPARTQNVDPSARDNSSSDSNSSNDNSSNDNSSNDTPRIERPRVEAPRVDTPRRDDPVPSPTRRRRERRTDVAPETRSETPREAAPRIQPERRRDTSPVPVPEGARGGGNSSPIPVPG